MKVRFSNPDDSVGTLPSTVFGRRLREIRTERGLSQTEIAQRMTDAGRPMTKRVVLEIENAKRHLRLDEALAFTRVLNVSLADLLEPPREGLVALTDQIGVDRDGLRRWLYTGEPIRVKPATIKTRQDRELAAAYLNDLAVRVVNAALARDADERTAAMKQLVEAIKQIESDAKEGEKDA